MKPPGFHCFFIKTERGRSECSDVTDHEGVRLLFGKDATDEQQIHVLDRVCRGACFGRGGHNHQP
jgi:hypothetical protein